MLSRVTRLTGNGTGSECKNNTKSNCQILKNKNKLKKKQIPLNCEEISLSLQLQVIQKNLPLT